MELVSLLKEVLQTVAERAASYRFGQSALRYMDRALWVIEKSARWAVPPPLDQDERPQPELIRPLPWVFFFALLIALRITRESISLLNLALGKPPLRSADVVTYIQSKRRYLRTLKYQGNRIIRARSEQVTRESWYSHLQTMFEFTMCFRRQHYGNNNTQLINGDEVMVVKRNKRPRQEAGTVASTSETSMERLIEKMMVDVDVDSDESSYTLTNITSGRSDRSDYNTDSDHETASNTQVNQSKDNKSINQTGSNTFLSTSITKIPVKQSDNKTEKHNNDDKTGKQIEENSSPAPFGTETPVKQSEDDKTDEKIQEITSEKTSGMNTHVKQIKDDKTEQQNQENIPPASSSTKTPVKQSKDSKTEKQIQENTSLVASSTKILVKQNQEENLEKQTEDISSEENNIVTSTPKKNDTRKLIDFDQSNELISRLDSDTKQERASTKDSTMDFIQNEIGSHTSEVGNKQYKVANGRFTTDLTTTER